MTVTKTELNNETGNEKERDRLEALRGCDVLDTSREAEFDDVAELAADICNTPMAVVTLIDEKRQWFKSRIGIEVTETPREVAFCDAVVRQREKFVVPDAHQDPHYKRNPMVTGKPFIRFYSGVPLITRDHHVLGTLAVLDRVPRTLTEWQSHALETLGHEVVTRLELRKSLLELSKVVKERDQSQEQLRASHRDLERKVQERTLALNEANKSLRAEIALRNKEARTSQEILDSLPGIVYVFDETGRYLRWNRNLERITGRSSAELAAAHALDLLGSPQEKTAVAEKIRSVLAGESDAVEANLMTAEGTLIPYYFSGVRIELDGRPCVAGMGLDISKRRMAEETLRLRNRAIQASVNAIIITDLEGNIEYTNPAFERITGYTVAEAVGRNCRFLQDDDREQPGVAAIRRAIRKREESSVLLRNYRKNGELFWNDVHVAPVKGPDGEVTHFVGVLNDITEIKHYEKELERQANFDPLTSLANRNVLKDRIRHAIATSQRDGSLLAVGFMDLDNFKFINDSLGHNIGDELLKCVAERLLTCVRGEDTVARYGGDEFAFVLMGQKDEKTVVSLMERILKTIDRPFHIGDHKFFVSCSIGLSFYPRDGADADTLLRNADAAMYRAKDSGRNNFQFYTAAMNRRATERLSMESRLRQALTENEFALHYQPKVDLRSGRIVGVEALLRWQNDGAMVPPTTFVPLAEETGLIIPIGEWVVHTACAQIKAMQNAGVPTVAVAVNISARQMGAISIVDTVCRALAAAGLAPGFLTLELTESSLMERPEEVIGLLLNLREMGVRIAIDDFGTGYSSLSYLQRFPVDHLKIDQSFVRDIGADPNDAIIARAVISLGHSLGMGVIAEGVSSQEQLAFLRENDCDEIQGYLFSRPLPIGELALLLKNGGSMPAC
jgi:diguanylate cyclase (GGDEF)-like protein/PAS domain S-box-containing protein